MVHSFVIDHRTEEKAVIIVARILYDRLRTQTSQPMQLFIRCPLAVATPNSLCFFILIILVIGLAILSKVIRTVLGVGRRMKGDESTRYNRSGSASQDFAQSQNTTHENTRSNNTSEGRRKGKVFDEDEGEYVDFEEIKE